MNDAPRQTLRALVARHGAGLCSDARRCEALLRDHAGAHRREVNILVGALKERVPLDLLAAQSAMPRGLLAARLAKRLEDHLALTPEAARWAVDSWALALGVVTEEEVAAREKAAREESQRKAAPPSTAVAPPPSPKEDADEQKKNQAAQTQTPPAARPAQPTQPARPAPPPRQQQSAPPPRATTHAPRATTPPPVVARPPAGQSSPPPAKTKTTGALPSPPQPPTWDVTRVGRRRTLRGCTVGCLLLALLTLALVVGGPFILSVLREEQQRRNLEPSPVLSP